TSIDELTLENLNLLLTDSTKRSEFASMCENAEVKRFFDEEFSDIYMQHFNDAILPVINFIGEYLLYLGGEKKIESLRDITENNRLTIIAFNPHFFGRNIIKFFAGSVVNQMYTLAINGKIDRKTILLIDEAPLVETKTMRNILSESRKFNLFMCLSVQYLDQFSKEVLDSVMSNVRNVISFKVTKEDARLLSSMMEIKVEEYFKKKVSPSELEQARKEMFVNLDPQECIVRLFDGHKFLLTMKVKTVDISRWEQW
ncbi:type IV secretory system conjugative DNA transfer family protein, partial [Candidatus Micrarchaeota archaeon]|nr:type IV secretory system conjugative DNA transfer family protein [Candidatus Micrarchaeota archaeon]